MSRYIRIDDYTILDKRADDAGRGWYNEKKKSLLLLTVIESVIVTGLIGSVFVLIQLFNV